MALEFSSSEAWGAYTQAFHFNDLPISNGSLSGWVQLPTMDIAGNSADGWTLSGGTIQIWNSDYSTLFVSGLLAGGDIIPIGSYATAYNTFQTDIVVTFVNNTIGSPILDAIDTYRNLDLYLYFDSSSSSFEEHVLSKAKAKSGENVNPLSGSITVVPTPGALVLGSIGLVLGSVGANLANRLRRRKTL